MRKFYIIGLIAVAALIIGIAIADEIKFSTYYPAPFGKYREFDTTGKTCLATDEWGIEGASACVGIGTTDPTRELTFGATDAGIFTDTSDGSDNKRIQIGGGGTSSNTRGAYINLYGNEYSGDEGDIKLFTGSSGVSGHERIELYTAGYSIPRVVIDASGNVGIGTADPQKILHVWRGNAGTDPAWSASDSVIFEHSSNNYITAFQPTGRWGGFIFSEPGTRARGGMFYGGSTYLGATAADMLHFYTAGSDQVVIDSTGDVGIGTANPISKLHLNTLSTDTYPAKHIFFSVDDAAGVGSYSMGIDSDDSNKFKIGASSNPVSTAYVTLTTNGDVTVSGCLSDGTCEIFADEDAVSIIQDIMKHGDGQIDEFGHEHMDMDYMHKKYPYLVVKEGDYYGDKLGAKSDLLYKAIQQLVERIEYLEREIGNK